MSAKDTATERPSRRLERARTDAARIAREATSEDVTGGETLAELAADLGVAQSRLSAYRDPEHSACIKLHELLLLPDASRVHVAAALLPPSHLVVDAPRGESAVDDMRAAMQLHERSARALSELLEGIADGHLTRAEGARIEGSVDALMQVLGGIRERARLAQREGVIGATGTTALRVVGGGR